MRYWSFIIVYQCNPDLWIMELPSTVGTSIKISLPES
jgi:hypothetical protein